MHMVGNVKNIFFMDIFVFDTKSIKIDSRSYNTIYRGPTPMYITKINTKMSREAAIIENICVSNYAPRRNRPKIDILGCFETFGGKSDQEIMYPSDIYKSIVL